MQTKHSDQSFGALPQYKVIITHIHNFTCEVRGQKDEGQSIIT